MSVKKIFIVDIDNFYERMLTIRKQKGLSQKTFSDLVGVAPSYIGIVEQGKRRPSFNFIMSVLKATQVSADWLLMGKGSMYPQIKGETEEIKEINEDRVAYGGDKSPGLDDVLNALKSHWDSLSNGQKKILAGMVEEMIEKNEMRKESRKIKESIIKTVATWPSDSLQIPSLSETSSAS
jgi:transcriptional regulator with XRE-family HTH domain